MRRLLLLLVAGLAHAHSFDPGLLDLRERAPGEFDVIWKSPIPRALGGPTPVLPAHCRRSADLAGSDVAEDGPVVFRVDCRPSGLRGAELAVRGLPGSHVDVLLRITWSDGTVTSGVLASGAETFGVPGTPGGASAATVIWRYGRLGVEHIWGGLDHLLFVLGLLLLVPDLRRLVMTITAFTVAHTVTLAATVLGLVHVPPLPVEASIAISIVLVATEAARSPAAPPTLGRRFPWLVALLFGLLHGFGFAGALVDLGLPPDHVPLALLAFNGGVEVGQLLFVVAMALPVVWLRRAPRWVQVVPPYAIGTLAVAWTIERVALFWA